MYSTQSSPRQHGMHHGRCGGHRSARRAAKRAKFEAWMQGAARRHGRHWAGSAKPPVNMKEEDDRYEIHLFAPGYTKEAFEIALADDILTIVGKADQDEDQNANWHRQEYQIRGFERKFELNDKIDSDEIIAEYENGVLLVTLQKKPGEERHRQSISVK